MSVSSLSISRVPVALALAGRVLPLLPLQLLLGASLHEIKTRHPHIFDRLGPHTGKRFGLDPTDLPLVFVLEPARVNPRVIATRSIPRHIDVRISGPLAALIGLANGAYDGDALFFSRDLQIEGDMEAALALRNAIDDARIDILAESVAWVGPLAPLCERFLHSIIDAPSGYQKADLASEGGQWS
jgi:predicted lipid carrier protein YhbT